ncbi:MAG: polysaccharide deacetylase family protein [Xanthobacteraceae bacterium]
MRRMTGLAAAVAAAVALGIGIGWILGPKAPDAPEAKAVDREVVTGTVASRSGAVADTQPQAAQPQSFPPPAAPMTPQARPAAAMIPGPPATARAAASPRCENPAALGVHRTVEIDTAGGPGFGSAQFKAHDFLEPSEIVLTFDDGPWPGNTPAVLAALAAECVKATFFPIGQHVSWHPEILRQVVAKGHTVGSHSWSHVNLAKRSLAEAKDEIENGISAVAIAAGRPLAPFFRFPGLSQTPGLIAYLAERNIGIFSIDLDSFDFKLKNPELVIASVMTKLDKRGRGIILMHDFQRSTAVALPALLLQLKAKGFKVVHLKAKNAVTSLPQYEAAMVKTPAGQTVAGRPTANVVRTIQDSQ